MKYMWLYHRQRLEAKFYDTIEAILPDRLLNTLALRRIAFVTSSDARLDKVVVPSLTVDQIIESIKLNERR